MISTIKKILCMLMCSSGIVAYGALLGGTGEAFEKMPVERPDLQAKLLRAVMKFSTRRLDQMTVGIVYVESAENIAHKFAQEIEKLTYKEQAIQVVFIKTGRLNAFDESVNVFYVTPGNRAFLETIFDVAAKRNIFSCTGVPAYVRDNKIALGFDEYKGKPQILLNLAVAKSTDHNFKNPKFLNLQATRKLLLFK